MEIDIACESFELQDPLRASFEERLRAIPTKLGAVTSIRVELKKTWVECKATAEMRIPGYTLTVRRSASEVALVIEQLVVGLTRLMRGAVWARDGVEATCRWCRGSRFVHVGEPHDRTETWEPLQLLRTSEGWRGHLEALVCRGCGHVEWFVTDPEQLPIGDAHSTTEVEARPRSPYRSPTGE